jgi:hypothetical protein
VQVAAAVPGLGAAVGRVLGQLLRWAGEGIAALRAPVAAARGVKVACPPAPAAAANETITLYHGSVSNYSGILRGGLDPNRAPTWVTTSRTAAQNAIGPGRVLSPGQGLDVGIVESNVTMAEFEALVESGAISQTRSWPGFGGSQVFPENVLRSPAAIEMFNRGIVR